MRSLCLTLLLLTAVAAFAPATSSANIIVGFESNGELANNGTTPEQQASALDKVRDEGATLIRVNISWNFIARGCDGQTTASLRDSANPCYDWAQYDSLVSLARARNIQLLASVTRVPDWVHKVKPAIADEKKPFYVGSNGTQFNRTVAEYSAFSTAIATRYNAFSPYGNIKLWTIWSEPNSWTFWQPMSQRPTKAQLRIVPIWYAQMYASAAYAIKVANPTAVIAAGPTGPNSSIKPVPFIKAFQKAVLPKLPGKTISQKRRYLGAFAHNPYPFVYAPTGNPAYKGRSFPSPDALGIADTQRLFALLDSAPITRGLKVWATEFGWETNPPDHTSHLGVKLANQAKWIPEGFDVLDRTGRVTLGIQYGLTDSSDMFDFQSGTLTNAGAKKPSYAAFQRMISTDVSTAKRGTFVNIWAKSNINPTKTAIQYSANGMTGWKTLPAPRRADGSVRKKFKLAKTICFATFDGVLNNATVRGPKRCVIVKK